MAKTQHRTNASKQALRLNALARARRMLNLKRKGEPLLPDSILKALAASNLPPDKIAYDARLKELEQGV